MSTLSRRRFISIAAASLASSSVFAFASKSAAKPNEWRGRVLGADASIKLYGSSKHGEPALQEALREVERLERQLSIYDPLSALSHLNRVGNLDASKHQAEALFDLTSLANLVHQNTEGLFDPTVQPLFEIHTKYGGNPERAALQEAISRVGLEHVKASALGEIRFLKPHMSMTFNGVGQGYITDKVRSVLDSYGFRNSLINIGEYSAGERVAKIGIADANGEIFDVAQLKNQAIATSSPSAYLFPDGTSHILHPSGTRHDPYWDTVSVVAGDAAIADAYSTALALTRDGRLAKKLVKKKLIERVFLKSKNGKILKI